MMDPIEFEKLVRELKSRLRWEQAPLHPLFRDRYIEIHKQIDSVYVTPLQSIEVFGFEDYRYSMTKEQVLKWVESTESGDIFDFI